LVGKIEGKSLVEPKGNELAVAKGAVTKGDLQYFQHSKSPTGIATSFENGLVAIKLLKVECSYDVFHDKIHVTNFDDIATSESVEGFEHIALLLRRKVLLRWGFDPGKQLMEDGLRLECLDHTFDPVREYLDGLKWDGVPRIDDWLMGIAMLTTPHSIARLGANGWWLVSEGFGNPAASSTRCWCLRAIKAKVNLHCF
jgi:hypothetical protein